jgi:glutamyl-tRNA synthetase
MVRTRFAPSPTGMLHVGGVRTALYNYLFAKRHGGQFLLRVEDTDHERSTKEAIDMIFGGLNWLDLLPDAVPVYQSARQDRHAEIANQLLAAGKAYKCFCTADELKAAREHAKENHLRQGYDRRCRDRTDAPDMPYCVRLKCPIDGETIVDDLVQGTVRVGNSDIDDMVIFRSDGTPTYLLAVVVDDIDMAITHVIRGDDHLTNTFRQVQIYKALDAAIPKFAHIPLIHGADGAKLAKRHGAASVLEFHDQGFLPEALCNYLLRLGWGHGDTEIISREEVIKIFDIADIGKAAARMDYKKLEHLNGVYMRQADDDRLIELIQDDPIQDCSVTRERRDYERLKRAIPALKQRAKTIVELKQNARFLFTDDFKCEPFSMMERDIIFVTRTNLLENWEEDFVDQADAQTWFVQLCGSKSMGEVAKALRMALTGSKTSPPMDSVLYSLGKAECIRRLSKAYEQENPQNVD